MSKQSGNDWPGLSAEGPGKQAQCGECVRLHWYTMHKQYSFIDLHAIL